MYRKILLGGVTAAVILGAGGTALALSGSDAPSPSPTSPSTSSAKNKHNGQRGHRNKLLRHLAHGQFVTTGKDGKTITHDVIHGTVTSVSTSSITVRAADAKSETFAVDKDTKIRERTAARRGSGDKPSRSDAAIGDLAKGDQVIVLGTGATKYVAKHIVEIK